MSAPEIVTFGCRLNSFESEVMRGHAEAAGLSDAVIVNTCAVTGEAVRQGREAKRSLLPSFGRRKAEAVRAAVEGAISSFWPASALQLHPDVTLYLDPESASLLTMRDYYRRAQENQQDLEERGLL